MQLISRVNFGYNSTPPTLNHVAMLLLEGYLLAGACSVTQFESPVFITKRKAAFVTH